MTEDLLRLFADPNVQRCLADINALAGYELPRDKRQPFLGFHSFITNPQPNFITRWRNDPETEYLYHGLVNGILGNNQNAFFAVHFHMDKLITLEREILRALEGHSAQALLGNSVLAVGNTLTLDFEYHGYVLAYRRCLEYLAKAICHFFKQQASSFAKLPKTLNRAAPIVVARELIEVYEKHKANFAFVITCGENRSTRDKISHYEFVSAGCLNINADGVFFAGGGERLQPSQNQPRIRLYDSLNEHTAHLSIFLAEFLLTFETAARAWDTDTETIDN